MKFISRSVECRDGQSKRSCGPVPATRVMIFGVAQRAENEQGKDSVFGHVCEFANEEHDCVKGLRGDVGEQPAHEGFNNARGMLERVGVAGTGKNKNHPDQHWQPIK